ncbi:DUF5076 domain-containing protein [Phreatobacter stygius]|uniref:DUF5076 domain-containing protein n=1 Tax=Phreatobacter stygius TaxID=1940610 RepID=A0A4D7BKE1_9HYPH|nr:DUF5076 domain-containing protein [Phreatobacter stygius]QCI68217.1 DUF5076 domain-containing protein [Phreatobacter stygius]
MTMPFDALEIPPTALDRGGVEILRAGIVEGGLHISLRRSFDDPQAWGIALADIARHVARIYAMETGAAESLTLERIRNMLDAEFDTPSDPGSTTAIS